MSPCLKHLLTAEQTKDCDNVKKKNDDTVLEKGEVLMGSLYYENGNDSGLSPESSMKGIESESKTYYYISVHYIVMLLVQCSAIFVMTSKV